jgi:hypothetical protein
MGDVTPGSALDQTAAGNPGDGRGDQSAAAIGKLRDFGQQMQDLATMLPMASGEFQQMQQLLKRVIVKAAQAGRQQTPSAGQVPGS